MRTISWAFPALLLLGCTTPAEQAANAERNIAKRFELYGAACEKAGFKRDTDVWRLCVIEYSPYGHHH